MVTIKLENHSSKSCRLITDSICARLVGNDAFINNDIIVSDCGADENQIVISLGSDNTPDVIICGEITSCASLEDDIEEK